MRSIKVLVVDDSLVFRELLIQNLSRDPAITVVAAARDPYEARDAIIRHKPDVMTLDVELPRMNGIEFLRKLMPQYPLPVVVISALSDKVFDAMNAGAVDFVGKPAITNRAQLEDFIRNELLVKIKIASTAKIGNIKKKVYTPQHPGAPANSNLLVAIGASTGGTEAIFEVVKGIRDGYSRRCDRAAYAAGIYGDVCQKAERSVPGAGKGSADRRSGTSGACADCPRRRPAYAGRKSKWCLSGRVPQRAAGQRTLSVCGCAV